MNSLIRDITAMEILGSNGRPTVQCTVTTEEGQHTASVPIGSSRGKYEAKYLFDGGTRYNGWGVRQAVQNINDRIAPVLRGKDCIQQREIDQLLIALDGTEDKSSLGANAILAVSLAMARAGARSSGLPLYRYIGGLGSTFLPIPIATVLAGGKHSYSQLGFEDYLVIFGGFENFSQALENLVTFYHALGELLRKKFGLAPIISGGAYAPPLRATTEVFDLILEVAEKIGLSGKMTLGIDAVGTDLYEGKGIYRLEGRNFFSDELHKYYLDLIQKYPLTLIEDPFHEDDYESFSRLTSALPHILVVGDDFFATNPSRLKKAMGEMQAGNTLLLKVNQIGTLTEACDVAQMAKHGGFSIIVSARSSDTTDDFISDLVFGLGASHIKIGSPSPGEKIAKYNRLLEIEHHLGPEAKFGRVAST